MWKWTWLGPDPEFFRSQSWMANHPLWYLQKHTISSACPLCCRVKDPSKNPMAQNLCGKTIHSTHVALQSPEAIVHHEHNIQEYLSLSMPPKKRQVTPTLACKIWAILWPCALTFYHDFIKTGWVEGSKPMRSRIILKVTAHTPLIDKNSKVSESIKPSITAKHWWDPK